MTTMMMVLRLKTDNPADELTDAIAQDSAWQKAAEHGLNGSAVRVDPDDPSRATVQTFWDSLPALRAHGEKLADRLVDALESRDVAVLDKPQSQISVAPWRLREEA